MTIVGVLDEPAYVVSQTSHGRIAFEVDEVCLCILLSSRKARRLARSLLREADRLDLLPVPGHRGNRGNGDA